MGETAEPFRLAIGLFHERQRLENALADLLSDGLGVLDMCLVGTRQAFDRLMPKSGGDGTADLSAAPLAQFQSLLPIAEDQGVVATSGALLHALRSDAKWQGDGSSGVSRILPQLLAKSSEHIDQGALALLVRAPDSILQHRSSRILLRHSAHTVQTHEFTSRQRES